MKYPVYFSDAGVPATGLTPAFSSLQNLLTEASVTPPTVTEIGGGWYAYEISPTAPLVGVIDGGAGLADADRYKPASIPVSALAQSLGSVQVTLQVNDPLNSVPVADVELIILNQDESLLVNSGLSNSIGQQLVQLSPGQYIVRLRKDGYNFSTPQTITVTVDATFTFNGTNVGDVAADFRSIVVPRSPILPHGV